MTCAFDKATCETERVHGPLPSYSRQACLLIGTVVLTGSLGILIFALHRPDMAAVSVAFGAAAALCNLAWTYLRRQRWTSTLIKLMRQYEGQS